MGSPFVAAWISHVSFWMLLGYGSVWGELNATRIVIFLTLWVAGFFGLPYVPYGASLFSSFVAVLDVALVLTIFKGDVRLT